MAPDELRSANRSHLILELVAVGLASLTLLATLSGPREERARCPAPSPPAPIAPAWSVSDLEGALEDMRGRD
ncbi:hypothetical protein [Methylobacterium oxalidis]|uniref:hypothetical protein n=1 Tax=Methylobacterium oxalidis TaxID=944322 RepID=UPI003314BA1A